MSASEVAVPDTTPTGDKKCPGCARPVAFTPPPELAGVVTVWHVGCLGRPTRRALAAYRKARRMNETQP